MKMDVSEVWSILLTAMKNLARAIVRSIGRTPQNAEHINIDQQPIAADALISVLRGCRVTERILTLSKIVVATVMIFFAGSTLAHGELNQSIDLTLSHGLRIQRQSDPRWGRVPVGPVGGGPTVNMARCGCFLTSLSTGLEYGVGGFRGSQPWFATTLYYVNGPVLSFNPRYVQAYLSFHPIDHSAPLDWGFVGGGSSTNCGVQLKPSAGDFIANPARVDGVAYTPTGLTWNTLDWGLIAREDVDSALQQGWPSIVTRQSDGGMHANLIVGWDNIEKRYLIYDPLWKTDFLAGGGVNYMGYTFEGATEAEKYSNYQAAIDQVKILRPVYEEAPSRWLTIFDDPEPIEFRLIDPRGRKTGHDPVTNENIQENKSAFYSEFTSWADPLGEFPEAAPVRYIAARDPEPGVYGLEVFGTGNGPFVLTLGTINGDRQQNSATITGNIITGEIKRYEVTYSEAGLVTYAAVEAFGPQAKAGNDASGYVGVQVTFDGRGSSQINGTIASYSWSFGDGTSAAGARPIHVYTAPGIYTATLTVTNPDGLTAQDSRIVTMVELGSQILKETIRVSVTDTGMEANNVSWFGAQLTPDGRYVTFFSRADNLVVNDTNGVDDIFVKDMLTGAVERVSVSSAGVQANTYSDDPSISADGRFIAFLSDSTNLAAGFSGDLYVHDRLTGTTEGIAQTGTSGANRASLSGDGRYIAFRSLNQLLPNAFDNAVYVRDRQLGTLELISYYDGSDPRLSADGRFIAYTAGYGPDNLDTNSGRASVYLRDRQTGTDELISRSASGSQISANSFNPSISADGRLLSFAVATNTSPVQRDVFMRDRLLGTTEQINTGAGFTGVGFNPSMDASGRYVTFLSSTNGQAYLRDRQAATTEIVSVANDGTLGGVAYFGVFDSSRFAPSVASNDSVVFMSTSPNLVIDDTNGQGDVFMRRVVPGTGGGSAAPLANLGGPYLGWATSVAVPAAIRLDGSGSVDPNGAPLTGHWDFGDGSPSENGALLMTHAYAQPGVYQVTLIVNSGGNSSAPAYTEVEVLPSLPADGISADACSAKGGTLSFDGAASAANAAIISNGWDTSTGPVQAGPVTILLPWGQVQVPTTLPGLAFKGSAVVPVATANGSYGAVVSGGPSAPFNIPCATSANLPPLAVAGDPIYMTETGTAVTLDGSASSDPENATLSYLWDFGDGTTGTGATPAHTYQFEGNYFITLIVNDGIQDSAVMIGTRSFAMVQVSAGAQQFPFEGFFAPVVNPPVVNLVQAGSAIPLKFSLGGDRGLNIFAAGYPKSQMVHCDSTIPVDGTEQTVTAGASSLTYNAEDGRYHYVWKTEKSWARTCRKLLLKLSDGSTHLAHFKFR